MKGVSQTTTNHIVVDAGVTADITLKDVNIENYCAFSMAGATWGLASRWRRRCGC